MIRRLSALLLALLLTLAACGDGDSGDGEAATDDTVATSTTTTEAAGSIDIGAAADALRAAGFTDAEVECLRDGIAGLDLREPTDLAGPELASALAVLETCGLDLQRLADLDLSALAGLVGAVPGLTSTTAAAGSGQDTTDGADGSDVGQAGGDVATTDPETALTEALGTLTELGFTDEEIQCLAGQFASMGVEGSAALEEFDPATAFEAFGACGIGIDRLAELSG